MITYNHEKYIAQAVQSALNQEVDFPFEIVIGEDFSTDRTREIITQLQRQNPGRIRLLQHSHNLGMLPNFEATLLSCQGQYVALLEGDDYWVDDTKLQQQVNFLETHPEYSMCHTNAFRVIGHQGHREAELWHSSPPPFRISATHLLAENIIATCTVMYRNRLFDAFPDWFKSGFVGDLPLYLLNLRFGDAGYLDRPMGAYRFHDQSNWSTMNRREQLRRMIATLQSVRPVLPDEMQSQVDRVVELRKCDVLELLFRESQFDEASKYAVAELAHMSGYHRLRLFYEGLQAEEGGHRIRALWRLMRSMLHGWGRTRIGPFDILLAISRCISPSLYRWIRSCRGRHRSTVTHLE